MEMIIFLPSKTESFFSASAYRCPTICYEMIATENSANKFAFIFCGERVFSPTGELRPHIFMWKLCQFFLWSPAVGSSRELVGSSSFHPPLYENTTSFSVTFWMDGNEPKVFLKETTFMCVCGKVSCPKESATTTSFQIPPAFSSFSFLSSIEEWQLTSALTKTSPINNCWICIFNFPRNVLKNDSLLTINAWPKIVQKCRDIETPYQAYLWQLPFASSAKTLNISV